MRWINGRQPENDPHVDDSDFPKQYFVRFFGDDPRSGCVDTGIMTAQEIIDCDYPDYWEWLDESPTPVSEDVKAPSNIVEQLEEANPYPEKVFPDYNDKQLAGIVRIINGEGYSSDRIFGAWGRKVHTNAVSKLRELIKQQPPQGNAEVLVKALERIIEPIKYLRVDLKEGEQLNGQYAMQLSNDPEYLKGIAREALASYNTGKGEVQNQ